MRKSLPSRKLPPRPDLDQLKRQAKELLRSFRAGEPATVSEVLQHAGDVVGADFGLSRAQFVLARAYGFASWAKLRAHVDGITVARLVEAVRSGEKERVERLLAARSELVHFDLGENDERRALHFAVLSRDAEMVRLLMSYGADARKGVHPYRGATTPLVFARERGYEEIVQILLEEEARRGSRGRIRSVGSSEEEELTSLFNSLIRGEEEEVSRRIADRSELVHASDAQGRTLLHVAVAAHSGRLVEELVKRGAEVDRVDAEGLTPIDRIAALGWGPPGKEGRLRAVAKSLAQAGASLTARSAVALRELDWLREHGERGELEVPIAMWGGLLSIAVKHDWEEGLRLLIDLGFDPDERMTFEELDEPVFSWGTPLWHCASLGRGALAELLLARGADPNGQVYASGTPVFCAYGRRDWKLVELLRSHGGRVDAATVGHYRETELARMMLEEEDAGRLPEGSFAGESLAEELLWGGACGGDPEIVGMALRRIDWPRDDRRWYRILTQPVVLWNHMSGSWAQPSLDRAAYLKCFRSILDRCDARVVGRFGLTVLHDVAASRSHVTPEESVAFANCLLDAGAELDVRDELLCSTPLGWASRWGRTELVELFLRRGADPLELDSESWARPSAWAQKTGHTEILARLEEATAKGSEPEPDGAP